MPPCYLTAHTAHPPVGGPSRVTAVVTPFEVAFLPELPALRERLHTGLFWINRVVDLVFACDMLVQFRTAFKREKPTGTVWVYEPSAIAQHIRHPRESHPPTFYTQERGSLLVVGPWPSMQELRSSQLLE